MILNCVSRVSCHHDREDMAVGTGSVVRVPGSRPFTLHPDTGKREQQNLAALLSLKSCCSLKSSEDYLTTGSKHFPLVPTNVSRHMSLKGLLLLQRQTRTMFDMSLTLSISHHVMDSQGKHERSFSRVMHFYHLSFVVKEICSK